MSPSLYVTFSVCCQASRQGESSQGTDLPEHAADCGRGCWCVVTSAEREAVCSVRSQVQ